VLNVLTVLGTRPEAIKLAPVVHELRRRSAEGDVKSRVCVTGQHRDMLPPMLEMFGIEPDFDLSVMEPDQSPARTAAAILTRLEPVLANERPDWVLVQGDTTTAAAGALAAFYAGCRVGHVEAGLRTHDKRQPFPEEIHRRLAGVLADLHFSPTDRARQNLLREGIPESRISVTGNPVIDALQWVLKMPPPHALGVLLSRIGLGGGPDLAGPKLMLVTAHRRENHGEPLENICMALRELAEHYGNKIRIVYPVHRNPEVCRAVDALLGGVPHVALTPPLDYATFVHLMSRAAVILTDSGGVQEEAPALGVPVLVLRDVTERVEGVEEGNVRVIGTGRQAIVKAALRSLDLPGTGRKVLLYGDGLAAPRIVSALLGEGGEDGGGRVFVAGCGIGKKDEGDRKGVSNSRDRGNGCGSGAFNGGVVEDGADGDRNRQHGWVLGGGKGASEEGGEGQRIVVSGKFARGIGRAGTGVAG
jgi:UDP-N-acetylglucosamine 2-epimerase (non-hydrolysing)